MRSKLLSVKSRNTQHRVGGRVSYTGVRYVFPLSARVDVIRSFASVIYLHGLTSGTRGSVDLRNDYTRTPESAEFGEQDIRSMCS